MRCKIDFSQVMKDLDGTPMRLGMPTDGRVLAEINAIAAELETAPREKLAAKLTEIWGREQTLGSLVVSALLSGNDEEKKLGDDERIRRYELARKINKGGEVEFNDKERDVMKRCVGLRYTGSLVPPMIWELIENAERIKEAPKAEAGRARLAFVALVLCLAGCGGAATLYVQQHAAGLAATGLVAATASQVTGAVIKADELEERVEGRLHKDQKKKGE